MKTSTIWLLTTSLGLLGIFFSASVHALSSSELIASALKGAGDIVHSDLQSYAIRMLAALMLIQFTISNFKLLAQSSEIDRVFAKLLGSLLWFTFCYIVIFDGSSFIYSAFDSFLSKAKGWTNSSGYFSSTDVMQNGIDMFSKLMIAVKNTSNKTDLTSILTILGILPALLTLVTGAIIMFSCGVIAIKLLMIKIECAIVVAMSPLSFSLLGLDALRDQGIAPFKYLIALIYRIVVLSMTVAGMKSISDNLVVALNNMPCTGDVCDPWNPVFAAIFGYVVMAFIAFKSDVIASQLSSGSSSLSSGDMASSVAAGVAAGMAVATGGAAAMAAASSGKQGMSDFIKGASSMVGGGDMKMGPASSNGPGGGSPSGSSPRGGDSPPPLNSDSSKSASDLRAMAKSVGEFPGSSSLPMGSGADSAIQGNSSNQQGSKEKSSLGKFKDRRIQE